MISNRLETPGLTPWVSFIVNWIWKKEKSNVLNVVDGFHAFKTLRMIHKKMLTTAQNLYTTKKERR